ncbi:poly(A) polymerase [Streptomyces sp. NPDC048272]|uniref:poly(A) polymerase n=1 Tax=Streptomyces sp. NPDC048272 TaxID=3154616 RepID=UPI00343B8F62
MRTSEELYHQVRWDPRFDPARFTLGLLQRGAAPKRVPLPSFVPGGDIPWHRVLFVEADGELVWDRATGVDVIDGTRAGRIEEPRLLDAPFFTARIPHAWDPAGEGAWRPAEPATGPLPVSAVRLLTWNTLWDRYDGPRIATALRRPMLLSDLARADADVIALQEVEPALLTMLLAQPWVRERYTVAVDPRGRDVAECGLLILSRLPVREAGLHVLRPHKAVLAVTVDTAAGPLVVANTHLTSDHSEHGADRRRDELASLAHGLGSIDASIALVGDFNDGRVGAEGPAAALGLRDAWTEVHGAADDTPTFDPSVNPLAAVGSLSGRAARLDRILLRSPGVVRSAALRGDVAGPDGLFVSDHFGVEAVVGFDAPDEGPTRLDVAATARTAVAWLAPADPVVEGLRRAHDPQVDRWPAHVNLLFGFVPEAAFEAALPLLAHAAAGTAPFTARLEGVHDFGHREDSTVWLDPAAGGSAPWQELRQALAARFPGCRGHAEGYTPHLTLGRCGDPRRAVAEFGARLGGARRARVGSLAVLSRRGDGPMEVRATVELGTGDVRWVPETGPPSQSSAGRGRPDPGSVLDRVARALGEGVVHVAGSRRMGCALPDADLDLVAAVAGEAPIEEVRDRVAAALPEAERLRTVAGARVPGLRFRVAGLDVDLVVVSTGAMEPARAVAGRAELGEAARISLSAVADADAVRDFVGPEHAAFAGLAREVKAWARARGVDSAPFGGLPGLAWSVLAARTVREASDLAPAALLREFFGTWAAWDWREPVSLGPTGSAAERPAGPERGSGFPSGSGHGPDGDDRDPVTVLTPSEPVRSCTTQVGPGMRDLLVRELYAAWEALESGADGPLAAAGPPPHRRHAAWAVVTVRGEAGEFEDRLGRMRGRLRSLLGALEEGGVGDAHAWPRPFESNGTLTRWAIGLGSNPPAAADLSSLVARWTAGLPGVTVEWVEGGAVPALA